MGDRRAYIEINSLLKIAIFIRSLCESRLASSNVSFDEHPGHWLVNYSHSLDAYFEGRVRYVSIPNIKMAVPSIVEIAIACTQISRVPRKRKHWSKMKRCRKKVSGDFYATLSTLRVPVIH